MKAIVITTCTFAALLVALPACGGGENDGVDSIKEPDPPVGEPLLPDIAPAPPQDPQIRREHGRWVVRFSTTLINIGDGDFLLRATRGVLGGWTVEQDVQYSESGAKVYRTPAELVWGGDGHDHWHVERIAVGRLAPFGADGQPPEPGRGLADTKVGFCYYDHFRYLDDAAQNPGYSRLACGKQDDQAIGMGMSYGWIDRYDFRLPGQSIDVTDLPDGKYRLWLDVDEKQWFREKRRDNNVTWADFDLGTKNNGARAVTNLEKRSPDTPEFIGGPTPQPLTYGLGDPTIVRVGSGGADAIGVIKPKGGGMRKIFLLAAVVAALAMPAAAIAATWDNTKNGNWVALGAACPQGGSGAHTGGAWYHFVLNQVDPDYFDANNDGITDPITLTATFGGPPAHSGTVGPTAVNKNVIHFDVFGVGMISGASTTPANTGADSKLVISGAVCGKKGFPDRA